jgi:hypothetical protein
MILSGEEFSGKSYAVNYFAEALSKQGVNVVKVPEDTSPFFVDGTKTFDDFLKLPAAIRRSRSFEVFQKRIQLENEYLYSDKYPDNQVTCVLLDRPWWDTFYYSLRRSIDGYTGGEQELSAFDIMSLLHLSGFRLAYPEHCMTIVYNMLPLSPKFVTENEQSNCWKRPSRVLMDTPKERLHRLKWFANYNTFLYMFSQLPMFLSSGKLASPFLLVNELNDLILTPEITKLSNIEAGKKYSFLLKPSEEIIDSRPLIADSSSVVAVGELGKKPRPVAETGVATLKSSVAQLLVIRECVRLAEGGYLKKTFADSLIKSITDQVFVPNARVRQANLNTMLNTVVDFLNKVRIIASEINERATEAQIQEGDPDMMKRLFDIASKGGKELV